MTKRHDPTPCPECKGTGKSKQGTFCWPCEGFGSMSRMQANNYYGEGGVNDAEEEQAYLDRREEERST